MSTAIGTLMTAFGNLFFSVVEDGWSYWAYGFPSAVIVVFGADFVFSSGTLFIAKCALPHEQSVGGALFSVMTQVWIYFLPPPSLSSSHLLRSSCRDGARMTSLSDGSIGHQLTSIDETLGRFIRCWLVTFLVWFRTV